MAQTKNALVVQDKDTLETLLQTDEAKQSFIDVMPKIMTVDKVMKMALIAVSKTPKLLQCTKTSFLQSVIDAAELGLTFGGAMATSYLIPYGKECQFQVGYKGLIELAYRSGKVNAIESHVIYDNDEYYVEHGTQPKLIHKPLMKGDRGPVVAVYAVAILTNGTPVAEVMTVDEVEKVRAISQNENGTTWTQHWGQMARKTVIKRLANSLPKSPELIRGIEIDNSYNPLIEIKAQPADIDIDSETGEVLTGTQKMERALTEPKDYETEDDGAGNAESTKKPQPADDTPDVDMSLFPGNKD